MTTGRSDDELDPRERAAEDIKRQREADTAASTPSGGAERPAGGPVEALAEPDATGGEATPA